MAEKRRRRDGIPSFSELIDEARAHAGQWEKTYLGDTGQPIIDSQGNEHARTFRGKAFEDVDAIDWFEKYAADERGDSAYLLPYQPTPSTYKPRPRTRAAGYNRKKQELRVEFRDGSRYVYYDVPPNIWRNLKRVVSPGRFVDRVLSNYAYERETEASIDDSIYNRFRRRRRPNGRRP